MNPDTQRDLNAQQQGNEAPEIAEFQRVFAAMIENAAQEMRQAIAEVEQRVSAQLQQSGLDGLQPDRALGIEAALIPNMNDMVAGAFAQTKTILDQVEDILATVQTNMQAHQENLLGVHQEQHQNLIDQVENASDAAPPGSSAPQAGMPLPVVPVQAVPDALAPPVNPPMPQASESFNTALAALLQTP